MRKCVDGQRAPLLATFESVREDRGDVGDDEEHDFLLFSLLATENSRVVTIARGCEGHAEFFLETLLRSSWPFANGPRRRGIRTVGFRDATTGPFRTHSTVMSRVLGERGQDSPTLG